MVTTSGDTRSVRLWFENAPATGTVGTFSFSAIGPVGSLATLGLADADDVFGSFVNKNPTDRRFFPTLTGAQVNISAVPLPAGIFAAGSLAYDMMYGKGETPFLMQAREQGATHLADGLGMLVEQAAEAFLVWRGVRPDSAPVLAALREQLKA